MTVLRVIFGLFVIACLWLTFIGLATLASGSNDIGQILKTAFLPVGFMGLCAFCSVMALLKSKRIFAYLAIAMMAIITGVAGYIPIGIGMHYHPDTNYTPWVAGLISIIAIIAFSLIFMVRRHFEKSVS